MSFCYACVPLNLASLVVTYFAQYFDFIGINKPTKCTLESLNQVIRAHMSMIPYQNFNLVQDSLNKASPAELINRFEPEVLLNQLVTRARGGMCYETSELLYLVLCDCGFDVMKIRSVARVSDNSFADKPYNHQSLVVTISDERYLVDPGFGFRGLFGALPFSLNENTETTMENGDRYKVELHPNCYRLSAWMSGRWLAFYDLDRPFSPTNNEEARANYYRLISNPNEPIARQWLAPGLIQRSGNRIGFRIGISPGTWNASMTFFYRHGEVKQLLNTPKEVQGAVKKHLKLELPQTVENLLVNNHHVMQAAARSHQLGKIFTGACLLGLAFAAYQYVKPSEPKAPSRCSI